MDLSKLSFKKKVVLSFMAVGLVPMLISAFFGIYMASNQAEILAKGKLEAVGVAKKDQVEKYFETIASQIKTFSSNGLVIKATQEFTDAVSFLEDELPTDMVDEAKLRQRYVYQEDGTEGAPAGSVERWMNMDATARLMQHLYISANTHPIGEKENLDNGGDGSMYSALHETYHPTFRKYLREFGFYDIFLVDAGSGRIVYSVFKEVDYGTSMINGPYSNTGIGRVAQKALQATKKDTVIVDNFTPYEPSYNAQASFMASPVFDAKNKLVGALIFQMPIDKINEIVGSRAGLGETGEFYIVGNDKRMLTDAPLSEEKTLGRKIDTSILEDGFGQETRIEEGIGYKGTDVVSLYQELKIPGLDWGLIAEIEEQEILAPILKLKISFLVISLLCLVVVVLVGLFAAKVVLKPVKTLSDMFNTAFTHILSLMDEMKGATSGMIAAAEETSTQATVVKQNSSQASSNADSVAAAVEEMDATIQQINNSTSQTTDKVKEAVDSAAKTSEVVADLDEASQKITDVVRIINDLADQINLLALNAAIEAARAGDAGRGFAVVADEVKKLADGTATATKDIAEHIDQISSVSKESATAIDGIKTSIELINDTIQGVTTAVVEQTGATTEISERINDTVQRISDVDNNMQGIEQAAQDTATASSQVSQTADKVSAELTHKKEEVDVILKELGLS